jgi:hypothetical protein
MNRGTVIAFLVAMNQAGRWVALAGALLAVVAGCESVNEPRVCTDEARPAVQGDVSVDGAPANPDRVELSFNGGEPQACSVEGSRYWCLERATGEYVVTVVLGDQTREQSVSLEDDGCHIPEAAELDFAFEPVAECERASDCTLFTTSCCACNLELGDVVALSQGEDAPETNCEAVDCNGCPEQPTAPPVVHAECDAGQCVAVDVREQPYTACDHDSDCTLTAGGCCGTCEALDVYNAYAVRKDALGEFHGCADSGSCPSIACEMQEPRAEPYCNDDGRCAARPITSETTE